MMVRNPWKTWFNYQLQYKTILSINLTNFSFHFISTGWLQLIFHWIWNYNMLWEFKEKDGGELWMSTTTHIQHFSYFKVIWPGKLNNKGTWQQYKINWQHNIWYSVVINTWQCRSIKYMCHWHSPHEFKFLKIIQHNPAEGN